ncbi:MAG TPA: class I SAM-dependent methyltransferase [Candidatus Acidoferrales bacterium]
MSEYRPVQKSYRRQARRYERRWRTYNQVTLQATLEAVHWNDARHLLNVSCGTGLLEEAAGRRHPGISLTGVDLSLPMLEQARRKSGLADSPWFVNALAEHLPFASESFDTLVCANAFHFYRRPLLALQEMRRVLRPRGQLVLTDWCDDYWTCKVCDLILRVVDRSHFHTYGLAQCQRLLDEAGFHVEHARRFKVDWLWGLMTLRAQAA